MTQSQRIDAVKKGSSFKEAVFLSVDILASEVDDKDVYVFDRLSRTHWLLMKKRKGKTIEHFHEGNELLVWVHYWAEFGALPDQAESYDLMVKYFNGETLNIDFREKR